MCLHIYSYTGRVTQGQSMDSTASWREWQLDILQKVHSIIPTTALQWWLNQEDFANEVWVTLFNGRWAWNMHWVKIQLTESRNKQLSEMYQISLTSKSEHWCTKVNNRDVVYNIQTLYKFGILEIYCHMHTSSAKCGSWGKPCLYEIWS